MYCNKFKHLKRVASICVCAKVRQLQSCMCLCVFAGGADSRHWQKKRFWHGLLSLYQTLTIAHTPTDLHAMTGASAHPLFQNAHSAHFLVMNIRCQTHTCAALCCICFFSKLENAKSFDSHFYQTKTHLCPC